MQNQFGRDRNRNQSHERDRNDDRSGWESRSERDEDGGWARGRDRDDDSSRSEQRGYGRGSYGESGLGEPNRGESWGQGSMRYGQQSGGYGGSSGYRQGSSGYGSSERGGFGSQSDRNRDFGTGGSYGGGGYGAGNYGIGSQGSGSYGSGSQGSGYGGSGYGSGSSYGGSSYGRGSSYGSGGGYAGRGPKDYKRTDERIREDVCDRLSQDDEVDASDISVRVENGEVTLEGTTETRRQKHRAEEIAEDVHGVDDVHNNVRVRKSMLTELKDKVTGNEEPTGGHAGSGTKTTASSSVGSEENRY